MISDQKARDPEIFPDSIWDKIQHIEGWHFRTAAEITWVIIRDQVSRNSMFSALELGVYKGKYLSLISAAACKSTGPIVGIDALNVGIDDEVTEDIVRDWVKGVSDCILWVSGDSSRFNFIRSATEAINRDELQRTFGKFRFISVDAGHEYENVINDLGLAQQLLADDGVIAADDVFNCNCPGVVEAVCDHMKTVTGRDMAPFAHGGNKLFICRREYHPTYLSLIERYVRLESTDAGRASQALRTQYDGLGFRAKMFGYELVSFPI